MSSGATSPSNSLRESLECDPAQSLRATAPFPFALDQLTRLDRTADMPHGAIRWSETRHKLGYLELIAISAPARAALERYLRLQPRLGSAPLFPNLKRLEEPILKIGADDLLRSAEKQAKLPKFDRGLWHPYRRAWASSRNLPDVDMAKGGGWRDLATMKAAYQQADGATTLKAIENEPASHQTVTAPQRSADGATS